MTEIVVEDYMQLGIHNNKQCVRCGACCIYFEVEGNDVKDFSERIFGKRNIFKKAGEVCPHFTYDLDTGTASCNIYNDGRRPEQCKMFFCSRDNIIFGMARGKYWHGLQETAKNMSRYFSRAEPV